MADLPSHSSPDGAAVSQDPATILLVEDHEDSAAVFTRLLTRRGYRVVRASTVKEGRALLEREPVDLLIADLSLPDGNGLELMTGRGGTAKWRAISLSGYGAPEDLQRSREAGFSLHLVKPVDFVSLHTAIQDLLKKD